MKKIVFILTTFVISCAHTTQKNLINGITYTHLQQDAQSIHLLNIDPDKASFSIASANNSCIGLETTSNLAKQHNAIAAINGGFSNAQGIPAGALKIDGEWFSDTRLSRGALGWSNATDPLIDIINIDVLVRINNQSIVIARLNQKQNSNTIVMYNKNFGTTTATNNVTEVVIKNDCVHTITKQGNSTIPHDGCVISFPQKSKPAFENINIGDPVKITYVVTPKNMGSQETWQEFNFILGGTPMLVQDGKLITDFSEEKVLQNFIDNRYARTAIGILPDGHWLLVVVDQKDDTCARGMTLHELANFMYKHGCIQALNLCGGKSSTMFIDGDVVSFPLGSMCYLFGISFEKEVSEVLLITKK